MTLPHEEDLHRGNNPANLDREIDNLSKRLYEVELYAFERNKGSLRVSAHGPTDLSVLVVTEMYWQGMTERSESYLKSRHKVSARVEHASFGIFPPPRITTGIAGALMNNPRLILEEKIHEVTPRYKLGVP
jgi:hypothetical protein